MDERKGQPIIVEEWLQWRRSSQGKPFRFLDVREGKGRAVSGEFPDEGDNRDNNVTLNSPDLVAVNALGQFSEDPRVAALRDFITGWYVSYFTVDEARTQPEAGPQEHLSRTGDNLANVIQYLQERDEDRLKMIFDILRRRVPRIEKVLSEQMPDGRLLLQIKDAPFSNPILARFSSDGTLKMLAYLLLLHDPAIPPFIGIEEPENFLHPRLLPELAEECRAASEGSQLLATTHSPFFLDSLKAEEVCVMYRDDDGFANAMRASNIEGIPQFIESGASLGNLWMEGRFGMGDPFVNQGAPRPRGKGRG